MKGKKKGGENVDVIDMIERKREEKFGNFEETKFKV